MKIGLVTLAAACLLSTVPAYATDLSKGLECKFAGQYEGDNPTVLIVSQDQEDFDNRDAIYVFLNNDAWSIKSGDKVGVIKITNLTNGAWLSNEGFAGNNSFIVQTRWEHFEDVFDGLGGLHITNSAGKTIDRLKQDYMDVSAFRSCRAKKVSAKAEQERKDGLRREIPADPFAK